MLLTNYMTTGMVDMSPNGWCVIADESENVYTQTGSVSVDEWDGTLQPDLVDNHEFCTQSPFGFPDSTPYNYFLDAPIPTGPV